MSVDFSYSTVVRSMSGDGMRKVAEWYLEHYGDNALAAILHDVTAIVDAPAEPPPA